MNSEALPTPPDDGAPTPRPLGFWLKTVDRLLATEIGAAFDDLDVTRREWRLLNLLAGEVRDERLTAKLEARPHLAAPLVERGWVTGEAGDLRLTDDGRAALAALGERVAGIRSRVAGAVPADDYATTLATLEAIARELGWNEEAAVGGGRRRDRFPRRGCGNRRGAGADHPGEVHVHVHVHGDRAHRGERHPAHDRGHRHGRCARTAG